MGCPPLRSMENDEASEKPEVGAPQMDPDHAEKEGTESDWNTIASTGETGEEDEPPRAQELRLIHI